MLLVLWLMPFVRFEPAPVDFLVWGLAFLFFFRSPRALWAHWPRPARWGLLLIGITHMSLLWVPDLGRGLYYTLATLEMVLILSLFSTPLDPQRQRRLGWAYIGGSTLAGILGILAFFQVLPSSAFFLFAGRARALFKDPNVFGSHLVIASLLLLGLSGSTGSPATRRRWCLEGGISFTLTLGVLLAASRTAWVGYVVGVGLFVGWLLRSRKRLGTPLGLDLRRWRGIAVGATLALSFVAHPQVWALLQKRAVLLQSYDRERFQTQAEALIDFFTRQELGKLFFGVGPGQSEVILQYATHNLYVRVLYEHGLLGAAGLGLLLLALGTRCGSARCPSRFSPWQGAIIAALGSLLLMGFWIDSLHWRHLFFIIGLGWNGGRKP